MVIFLPGVIFAREVGLLGCGILNSIISNKFATGRSEISTDTVSNISANTNKLER